MRSWAAVKQVFLCQKEMDSEIGLWRLSLHAYNFSLSWVSAHALPTFNKSHVNHVKLKTVYIVRIPLTSECFVPIFGEESGLSDKGLSKVLSVSGAQGAESRCVLVTVPRFSHEKAPERSDSSGTMTNVCQNKEFFLLPEAALAWQFRGAPCKNWQRQFLPRHQEVIWGEESGDELGLGSKTGWDFLDFLHESHTWAIALLMRFITTKKVNISPPTQFFPQKIMNSKNKSWCY